jgi:hypothetical protein
VSGHLSGEKAEVLDQAGEGVLALLVVAQAQDRRGVDGERG